MIEFNNALEVRKLLHSYSLLKSFRCYPPKLGRNIANKRSWVEIKSILACPSNKKGFSKLPVLIFAVITSTRLTMLLSRPLHISLHKTALHTLIV